MRKQFIGIVCTTCIVMPKAFAISMPIGDDAVCRAAEKDSLVSRTEFNNELRLELIDMLMKDQEARRGLMNTSPPDTAVIRDGMRIDRENTARMREIIETYGWPGKSMVGLDGVSAAGMLVLHAVADEDFQRACLPLMGKAAEEGEMPALLVAMLTDRVLVLDGKKQRYGTQGTIEEGEFVLFPLEDEEHIDSIRTSVGLPPLAEYKKMMKSMLTPQDSLKRQN